MPAALDRIYKIYRIFLGLIVHFKPRKRLNTGSFLGLIPAAVDQEFSDRINKIYRILLGLSIH